MVLWAEVSVPILTLAGLKGKLCCRCPEWKKREESSLNLSLRQSVFFTSRQIKPYLIEIFEVPLHGETKLPLHGAEAQIHFKHRLQAF